MTLDVIFLGILKYKDKQTGEYKYRVSYLLNNDNAKQDTDTYKGLNECSFYTSNSTLFDKLNGKDALTSMKFVVESRPSYNNPLKQVSEVTKVITKNDTIDLI